MVHCAGECGEACGDGDQEGDEECHAGSPEECLEAIAVSQDLDQILPVVDSLDSRVMHACVPEHVEGCGDECEDGEEGTDGFEDLSSWVGMVLWCGLSVG